MESKIKRVATVVKGSGGGYVTVTTYKFILLEDGTRFDYLLPIDNSFNANIAFAEPGDTIKYSKSRWKDGYCIDEVIFKD